MAGGEDSRRTTTSQSAPWEHLPRPGPELEVVWKRNVVFRVVQVQTAARCPGTGTSGLLLAWLFTRALCALQSGRGSPGDGANKGEIRKMQFYFISFLFENTWLQTDASRRLWPISPILPRHLFLGVDRCHVSRGNHSLRKEEAPEPA